ncbi:MAG: hypothetical protein ABSH46_13230 [Bryobacteraceae bacterium]|jgi:hypothetical protein
MGRRVLSIAVVAVAICGALGAQGFGKTKKKVTLLRKLPPIVSLPSGTLDVKVSAANARYAEVTAPLAATNETALIQGDTAHLSIDKEHPSSIIACTITDFSIPPARQITRNSLVPAKNGGKPQVYYEVTGTLVVAYQAKTSRGKVLDSLNVTAKFAEEYDQQGDQTSHKSLGAMVKAPIHKVLPGKSVEEDGPPTVDSVRQTLIERAAGQIAERLVNTEQRVPVLLARGELDDANRFAEAGLWAKMLEALETMHPLEPEEDAYRIYNIGVAYEAMAYHAEDSKTARKFFDEAAINYGRAVDARPSEKYFLEPQNRIRTAIAHYRKLAEIEAAHNSGPPAAAPSGALTNDQVVQMSKAGLSEDNILATIREARRASFDLSVDAQVHLAQEGVSNRVIAAMRDKSRAAPVRRAAHTTASAQASKP